MFAYTINNKQSANGVSTKFKFSEVNIEQLAEKRYPNYDVEVTENERDIEVYAFQMIPVKIETVLPTLFDTMHQLYCIETLHASCSKEDGTVDHKLYNMAEQRYYARIKNLWTRKEKYIVKLLNLYLSDEKWIYYKGNIYRINLNNPQIFYIHVKRTLTYRVKYAAMVEQNHAKAAVLLIDNIGCSVAEAYKILKAFELY